MNGYPRYFQDIMTDARIIVKFATPNMGVVVEGPISVIGNSVHMPHSEDRWIEVMYPEKRIPSFVRRNGKCWLSTQYKDSEKKSHPFLNPDNPHYAMIGGVEAIEEMEKIFTRDELMAWAKITAMKYRLRIGAKDGAEQEVKKIKEYEAYYKYLEEQK